MARCLAIASAVLAAVAFVVTGVASGAPRLQVGVTDDAWLMFGPGTAEDRAQELHDMGAEIVRVTLDWRRIESQEGTFDWERGAEVLEGLRVRGVT